MSNYYPDYLIDEIRISNDIVDVVSEYVKLEKKGKDFFGLCPFHKEKTPSFSVAPAKQIFYCFGCGKGGNVIQFIMNAERLEYIEAVKFLADRAKIQLPEDASGEEAGKLRLRNEILDVNKEAARFFYKCLVSQAGSVAMEYLANRGISGGTIKKFGLGYAGGQLYNYLKSKGYDDECIVKSGLISASKNGGYYEKLKGRIIFPIFDLRGAIVGFGGRVLDSSVPKYLNTPETPVYSKGRNLYALNFAKASGSNRIIVVEGYMDAISLHQHGITNAVASLGTALTESQGRLLKKYSDEIIISYDADAAGQAAAMRGLDLLNEIGCGVKVLMIPEGKDPDEYIRNKGVEAFNKLIDNALPLVEYKIRTLRKDIKTDATDDKIKFLNKMADVLSKIGNDVEREMYIKKLAKDYGISEESVYSEVYKRIKAVGGGAYFSRRKEIKSKYIIKTNGEGISHAHEKEEDRTAYDERMILALLCIENRIYKEIKGKIGISDFTDEINRKLAAIVFDRMESGKGISPAELLDKAGQDAAGDFSRIFRTEGNCDDIKKAILGKIISIEMRKTERRLKEIAELLKNESSLSEEKVAGLKRELLELTLFIKERKSG